MDKTRKQEIIQQYKLHEGDTGSPEVQIAILTDRINHLNEHLKSVDIERYRAIIEKLNLRK